MDFPSWLCVAGRRSSETHGFSRRGSRFLLPPGADSQPSPSSISQTVDFFRRTGEPCSLMPSGLRCNISEAISPRLHRRRLGKGSRLMPNINENKLKGRAKPRDTQRGGGYCHTRTYYSKHPHTPREQRGNACRGLVSIIQKAETSERGELHRVQMSHSRSVL